MFSTLAWLKLQFLCHAGPTEIGGFGLSAENDPLFIEDVLVVRQTCSVVSVMFDDAAVADLFDTMTDAGVPPSRFARIWLHTHPDASVTPSGVDEETFARVFGGCDWSVMAILGRTGRMSARLRITTGPGATLALRPRIDWFDWPALAGTLDEHVESWRAEYTGKVQMPKICDELFRLPRDLLQDPFDFSGDWHGLEESARIGEP
ncbi:MAG: hypothetical protein U0791_25325 [Gemmataceae bacterium]